MTQIARHRVRKADREKLSAFWKRSNSTQGSFECPFGRVGPPQPCLQLGRAQWVEESLMTRWGTVSSQRRPCWGPGASAALRTALVTPADRVSRRCWHTPARQSSSVRLKPSGTWSCAVVPKRTAWPSRRACLTGELLSLWECRRKCHNWSIDWLSASCVDVGLNSCRSLICSAFMWAMLNRMVFEKLLPSPASHAVIMLK